MVTLNDFLSDPQGSRFTDVIKDKRIEFQNVIDFFNDPNRIRRMVESELHHKRPALAGVIIEFEGLPVVDAFFQNNDGHETTRLRQAVGVLVKIHMEQQGWRTTGKKGSLGVRVKNPPGTTTPGAYYNKSGLAKWFTRSERYEPSGK